MFRKHAKMLAMRTVTLYFVYLFCKEQAEEKG